MTRDPVAHGTSDWHRERSIRLTASDAPAILCAGEPGVHGNPLTVWQAKTAALRGEIEQPDPDEEPEEEHDEDEDEISDTAAMEYGRDTQPVHAAMLAKAMAKAGHVVEWAVIEPGFYVSETIPWLGASPDILGAVNALPAVVELKAPTNFGLVKALKHGMVRPYAVQNLVQQIVLDVQQGVVSVLYPPQPTWQILYRSPEMEAWILEGLERFWVDHVLADIPPPVDASWLDDDALKALNALYPPKLGSCVFAEPGDELDLLAVELENAKADAKDAETREKAAKARIIELSDGAELIYLPDGSGYTRRTSPRSYAAREAKVIEVTTLRRSKNMPR